MDADDAGKSKVKAVIYKENLTKEERARFNRTLSIDEIIKALGEGSNGPVLISKRSDPDDNVLVEYKKRK